MIQSNVLGSVGFYVLQATPSLSSGVVKFSEVISNVGSGWKAETNEFIVPFSGLYDLSFEVILPYRQVHPVYLRINRRRIKLHAYIEHMEIQETVNVYSDPSIKLILKAGDKLDLFPETADIHRSHFRGVKLCSG